jgi:hypothetical protein
VCCGELIFDSHRVNLYYLVVDYGILQKQMLQWMFIECASIDGCVIQAQTNLIVEDRI